MTPQIEFFGCVGGACHLNRDSKLKNTSILTFSRIFAKQLCCESLFKNANLKFKKNHIFFLFKNRSKLTSKCQKNPKKFKNFKFRDKRNCVFIKCSNHVFEIVELKCEISTTRSLSYRAYEIWRNWLVTCARSWAGGRSRQRVGRREVDRNRASERIVGSPTGR